MSSFGYRTILASNRTLAKGLERLPSFLRDRGTIDTIAVELEVNEVAPALETRTVALEWLAQSIPSMKMTAAELIKAWASEDPMLARWSAFLVARETKHFVTSHLDLVDTVMVGVEAYLRGMMPLEQIATARKRLMDQSSSAGEPTNFHATMACAYAGAHPDWMPSAGSHAALALTRRDYPNLASNDRKFKSRLLTYGVGLTRAVQDGLVSFPVRL